MRIWSVLAKLVRSGGGKLDQDFYISFLNR